MSDEMPIVNPYKREVGRRRIPGTHKIEIVYAISDPLNPFNETYLREVVIEKEESARKDRQ